MSIGTFASQNLKIVDSFASSDRKTVAVAGTSETLVAIATAVSSVLIQALSSNTLSIYIGFGTAGGNLRTPAPFNGSGFELTPGAAVSIEIDDSNKILVDVDENGEGCTFQTAVVV